MLTFLLYALLAYVLFRFVVGFVIPVYKTTRRIRKQFRDLKERMHQQQQEPSSTSRQEPIDKLGEYIDYEEVKPK